MTRDEAEQYRDHPRLLEARCYRPKKLLSLDPRDHEDLWAVTIFDDDEADGRREYYSLKYLKRALDKPLIANPE